MFLSDLKENQCATIYCINFKNAFAKRLADMGFCKGEKVVCIKRSLFPSPILFNVKGTNIALRYDDAKRIGVIL